jgi:UDP-N-acetylmuramoyl-tripeptide--D-alanyl-D-alanine ligase
MITIKALYQIFLQYPSVQTDTRKIKAGDIFFALKGPQFNGNSFAEAAIAAGAAYAIVEEADYATNDKIILLENVLSTLQALAKYHRQQLNIPFIAITGSNGKTTTKELVAAVLSTTFNTYTTIGNLNNHIGIPLTILCVKNDAQLAVIEMGANHQKEIQAYCQYTLPTHGMITNCGKAHLEGFGGEEGVRKGKGELYDFLRANNGTAFVLSTDTHLPNMSKGIPNIINYGTAHATVLGEVLSSEPFLKATVHLPKTEFTIATQLVGDYNLPNVLAAVAVGNYFKVTAANIKKAIEAYAPENSRSQLLQKATNTFILDAYNANPSSMKLAVTNFAKLAATKKIVMLGAMAELGNQSLEEHLQLIELIQQCKFEEVILVGGDFLKINHPFKQFTTSTEAGQWFQQQKFNHCHFLIKGSRSMQMEKILAE